MAAAIGECLAGTLGCNGVFRSRGIIVGWMVRAPNGLGKAICKVCRLLAFGAMGAKIQTQTPGRPVRNNQVGLERPLLGARLAPHGRVMCGAPCSSLGRFEIGVLVGRAGFAVGGVAPLPFPGPRIACGNVCLASVGGGLVVLCNATLWVVCVCVCAPLARPGFSLRPVACGKVTQFGIPPPHCRGLFLCSCVQAHVLGWVGVGFACSRQACMGDLRLAVWSCNSVARAILIQLRSCCGRHAMTSVWQLPGVP